MPFQLICRDHTPGQPENPFRRSDCRNYQEPPLSIGGEGCDCAFPDLVGDYAVIEAAAGHFRLRPLHPDVRVNGEPPQADGVPLRSGDTLSLPGHVLRFHLQFPKARNSRTMLWLTRMSVATLLVMLVVELLLLTAVTPILKNGDFWHGQTRRQLIVHHLDTLNRELAAFESSDPATLSLIREISQDLTERKHYLREYTGKLLPRQRRQMEEDLAYWQDVLDWLKSHQPMPPLPELDFEQGLEEIIRQNTLEGNGEP